MTDRSSWGNWVRIRVSSATATFLAARKQPRRSIERLMSTSRTVEVRVSCSVRKTSKSAADRLTPRPDRSPAPGAFSGQPGEQVVEDLLADSPAAARCQLELLAAVGQVAGLLELAGELVEGGKV